MPDHFQTHPRSNLFPCFLKTTDYIVEARHHFLPFIRIKIDTNPIMAFKDIGGSSIFGDGLARRCL